MALKYKKLKKSTLKHKDLREKDWNDPDAALKYKNLDKPKKKFSNPIKKLKEKKEWEKKEYRDTYKKDKPKDKNILKKYQRYKEFKKSQTSDMSRKKHRELYPEHYEYNILGRKKWDW
jgi:acetyl-CoA carboxylase alpha subunit